MLLVRENDFSAVGGSLEEDGLSYHCEVDGDFQISDRSPKTLDEILNIILYHFENGISLPTNKAFGKKNNSNIRDRKKGRFTKQDTQEAINKYYIQNKIDKRNRIKRFVLAVLILVIVPPFAYLSFTGQLPFYLKSTDETSAVIIQHKPVRFIRDFKMLVTYSYEVDGVKYEGKFEQGKLFYARPLRQGDHLTIEYIQDDPKQSRPLSVLSTQNQKQPNEIRTIKPRSEKSN